MSCLITGWTAWYVFQACTLECVDDGRACVSASLFPPNKVQATNPTNDAPPPPFLSIRRALRATRCTPTHPNKPTSPPTRPSSPSPLCTSHQHTKPMQTQQGFAGDTMHMARLWDSSRGAAGGAANAASKNNGCVSLLCVVCGGGGMGYVNSVCYARVFGGGGRGRL